MAQDSIRIFDTTLRDGEQSPGATMNLEEKLLIAQSLDKMGVDIIEAGFPIASPGDFAAVEAVAKQTNNAIVCGLARAMKPDIEAAARAVKSAKQGRVHTFISTSPIHMQYQLNMDERQVLKLIKESVTFARSLIDDVEWSGMDATRSDPDFLCRAVETAIEAGASTVNIPDTVGFTLPEEYAETILLLKNRVPNIDKAIISVHCHDDLGLASANALAAVKAGARQIECTINGLGERAGNTAMEEVVMTINTRNDLMPYRTNIDTTQIARISKLVSTVTGFVVQKNKAIVGANAFAHESGIHQDGVLKHASTYEIMTPESVGFGKSTLVMGKHSGRHALKSRLEELGVTLGDNAFEDVFARFKALADKKKEVYDEDILSLVDNKGDDSEAIIVFEALSISCGSEEEPRAEIRLTMNGSTEFAVTTGDGPVDAAFNAIKELIPHGATLELYQVHAVTEGTDAQAEVTVRLNKDGKIYSGNGRDTDTMVASVKAYIGALNKVIDTNETINNVAG